jgi:flap endonuclease-1
MRLIYVFDGEAPELKGRTQESRGFAKEEAQKKYEAAKKREDIEAMGRYARQITQLNEEMIEESKELLNCLGIPVVQALGEGEAQAAYICRTDERIYAVASQDYDALLFSAPRLVQNLTLARKRRLASGAFVPVQPELIELQRVLNSLQISHEQLIALGILVGTDYNPGGVKGIGPKKALTLINQYKQPALIFSAVERQFRQQGMEMDFDWQQIFSLFKNPEVAKHPSIKFGKPNFSKAEKLLCGEHDFSHERVESAFEKLEKQQESAKQSDLKKWF